MKKVLVIGANGYLGSRLSVALANQGCHVVALVDKRFPYDSLKDIDRIVSQEFILEEIENLNGNSILFDVDTLYNFAWSGVNSQARNEAEVQVQNIMYGLKVMEFADYNRIKRVIVPGSAAEVGCGEGIITGNEKPAPSDMYSSSKVASRYICKTYAQQHDIELIWTLITSIYGPGRNDNNLISYVIHSLLKGEIPYTTCLEQEWDYLYVDDLINALILLGVKGKSGKVYPVGSGEHKQMREYVETIRDLIDPSLPLGIGALPYKNANKIDNQVMDISQLRLDTGYEPRVSFEEGIKVTINALKNKYQN